MVMEDTEDGSATWALMEGGQVTSPTNVGGCNICYVPLHVYVLLLLIAPLPEGLPEGLPAEGRQVRLQEDRRQAMGREERRAQWE